MLQPQVKQKLLFTIPAEKMAQFIESIPVALNDRVKRDAWLAAYLKLSNEHHTLIAITTEIQNGAVRQVRTFHCSPDVLQKHYPITEKQQTPLAQDLVQDTIGAQHFEIESVDELIENLQQHQELIDFRKKVLKHANQGNLFKKSYDKFFDDIKQTSLDQNEAQNIAKGLRKLMKDYASLRKIIFHFHWNRHHRKLALSLANELKGDMSSIDKLLDTLYKYAGEFEKEPNTYYRGSFFRRLSMGISKAEKLLENSRAHPIPAEPEQQAAPAPGAPSTAG